MSLSPLGTVSTTLTRQDNTDPAPAISDLDRVIADIQKIVATLQKIEQEMGADSRRAADSRDILHQSCNRLIGAIQNLSANNQ